ncbi:helix-turn-helix domain-containing protein [Pseudomonas sp. PAMC 29040]|uniref:helix-turn-helix domain-containing protein n=1 Tax=Pseudomonas sp. PAMC 29040 TaxID=2498450 RepID=UPI000F998CEF|nr:helix-turn-helix domain-containing protein [Pseudomonas sp. PAMC 29040]RUT37639.1 helix-turn-helix domain-containing protein [Pseudomonas sp. PAMC 29040]
MSWALQIPKADLADSSARHVLLCLANYASADGRGTFPSVNRLSEDTGLSERTVRYKLDLLREACWIVRGNQALAAVYIDQHDRRPVVYDLQLSRGANAAPRSKRGADFDAPGCNLQHTGVQISTDRGADSAPKPPLNHQVTEEQLQREFAGVIAEQDQQALAADDRQRFAMFAQWEPATKAMADQLAIAGLPSDSLTDEVISGFKGFHVAKPSTVDSAAGWCFRLATWIKRERVKTAGVVVQADAPGYDDEDTSWINGGAK